MRLCVLNASNPIQHQVEHDVYVDYRMGRKSCFEGERCVKQCTSWHSLSYALETEFFVYGKDKWQGCYQYDGILILVNRDIHALVPLVKKLKLMKKKVAISFHEGVQDLISGSGMKHEDLGSRWIDLYEIVGLADFYMNWLGQMETFFEGWFGEDKVKYCSHGAPIDWKHGFDGPWQDRPYDILVGTRTLGQRLSRNTLVSLGTLNRFAKRYNKSVHYLSEDGDIAPLLNKIGLSNITIHKGPLPWVEWLKFLSKFKVVAHMDESLNLGQICYDATMVKTLSVGSTCWNNMLLSTDDGGSSDALTVLLENVFIKENDDDYRKCMEIFSREIHPNKVRENLLKIFKNENIF